MVSAVFEALILPPLIALIIYILFVYAVIPLYRRRQRYAHYLPMSLTSEDENTIINRTRTRFTDAILPIVNSPWWPRRRPRAVSFDSYFGDEELEEGMGLHDPSVPSPREPNTGQRRLSRDLEAGFRDDSDEDEDDSRRNTRNLR